LAKLRKYGGKCVVGMQSIGQLRSRYGHDVAQALMANIATKVILRQGDGESADYFSSDIGDQEVLIREKGSSVTTGRSSGTSTSEHEAIRTFRTVMGSELMRLSRNQGYLNTSTGLYLIEVEPKQFPRSAPAFEVKPLNDLTATA
jgi:type IV secretory pathway TraG/TraD family ATPase VirD4